MTKFGWGAQNWSIKSEFAEKSDLIGPNGHSSRYAGDINMRNQLKYPRHHSTFFVFFPSVIARLVWMKMMILKILLL